MPRYLYEHLELFSHAGDGTRSNPGGDFHFACWIEAPDKRTALEWGWVLLGRYTQERFAHAGGEPLDGLPIRKGEIVVDPARLDAAGARTIPRRSVGEIPSWREPWRASNVER